MEDNLSPDYCLISKTLIEDRFVSAKAKTVYATLCCWPQGYNCSISNLSDALGVGKESVSSLLKELEDKGYIERNRIRGPDGRYDITQYHIFPRSTL